MTLTTNPKHPGWDVGAEVIYWHAIYKIAKVYRNGNVVLDDSSGRQWRPRGTSATGSGGSYYATSFIYLATPERIAELEENRQIDAARYKALRLAKGLSLRHD